MHFNLSTFSTFCFFLTESFIRKTLIHIYTFYWEHNRYLILAIFTIHSLNFGCEDGKNWKIHLNEWKLSTSQMKKEDFKEEKEKQWKMKFQVCFISKMKINTLPFAIWWFLLFLLWCQLTFSVWNMKFFFHHFTHSQSGFFSYLIFFTFLYSIRLTVPVYRLYLLYTYR